MNKKEKEVIQTVSSMLSKDHFIPKEELMMATMDLGWKPVTLNFALSRLKKAGAVQENENKEFILIKEFKEGDIMQRKTQYVTKRENYRREIKELTETQAEIKRLILENKSVLKGKVIMWIDENGMQFPLEIAGAGDITLRCRFYLKGFMKSEPETGALVYIPWDEPTIEQIHTQIKELLGKTSKSHLCVNFGAIAPAK